MAKSLQFTLISKHYGSTYFRCKTTVLAFTLSVTVMLLLTHLTSAPDDKSIGNEYCQKITEKASPIPMLMLHTKRTADTCASTQEVAPILLAAIAI